MRPIPEMQVRHLLYCPSCRGGCCTAGDCAQASTLQRDKCGNRDASDAKFSSRSKLVPFCAGEKPGKVSSFLMVVLGRQKRREKTRQSHSVLGTPPCIKQRRSTSVSAHFRTTLTHGLSLTTLTQPQVTSSEPIPRCTLLPELPDLAEEITAFTCPVTPKNQVCMHQFPFCLGN
jgi:hypothetical protein